GGPLLGRGAVRGHLPDQLQPLHLLRPVHRGLPDPRPDHDQRVRAVLADPPGARPHTPPPPGPAGARPPPHVDAEDAPPTIARYGPQASLSQESVEPVWALLRQRESSQA